MASQPFPSAAQPACRGLALLDVDGVVFRGGLINALARRVGWWSAVRTAQDCLDFDLGRMKIEELLRRAYGRLRGLPESEAWAAYRAMPVTDGAREAIQTLRTGGWRVVLMTSGIPDAMVKDLAARLGADEGLGVHAEVRNGRLTGKVSGELAGSAGKMNVAERLVEREALRWRDVVAVGDDGNNLPIMRRAGLSIGFRAQPAVRREARVLVEEEDLRAILLYCAKSGPPSAGHAAAEPRRFWIREILRKLIHMTAAVVPFLASRAPQATTLLLMFCAGIYFFAEGMRVYGAAIPLITPVGGAVLRRRERRQVAYAPLTLALGILFVLWWLPQPIAFACILIAAFGDSVASVVGQRWGRSHWPHNPRKTAEGSAAFFVVAFMCAFVYLPMLTAMLTALIAMAVESLPLEEWDNFAAPVAAGVVVSLLS